MSSPGFPMDALHSFGFYSFFRELCRLFLLLIYLYTLFVSYYDQQQDHHPTRWLRDQNVIALGLNFTKSNYYCHLRYFPFFLIAERWLSTSCLYETLFTKQYAGMCSSIGKVFKFNISETVTAMQCHLLVKNIFNVTCSLMRKRE